MNKIKLTPTRLFIIAFLLCFSVTLKVQAAPGDLDPTFGNGGVVTTPFTNFSDVASSIQVQLDGKIIVSGHSYAYDGFEDVDYVVSGFIARYNSSGTLDASFGSNGKIVTGDYYENVGGKTALQPDGKIVAIGQKLNFFAPGQVEINFAVWRYNANGTLDASFGTGGKVSTPVGILHDWARDVVLQPDGKIVVMGLIAENGNGSIYKFGIVRYNPDGSLDNNFGTGGKVVTALDTASGQYSVPNSMLIQPDGKIVLVGSRNDNTGYYTILVRYNPDGSLDSGFGTNGRISHPTGGYAGYGGGLDSVLQPDGKIIVAGYAGSSSGIARYNANGSVDTSFADNGIFRTESGFFVGNAVALQTDGKIIGFGFGTLSSGAMVGFAVARLNPNGSPDASFGTNGRRLTPIGTNDNYGTAVALQADGKILGGGGDPYYPYGTGDATIVRYAGDSTVSRRSNFDFDGDGRADVSVFRPSDGVWYLNRSTQGFSAIQFGLNSDKIVPADYDGDGKTDIAVYRDGTWYLQRSNLGFTGVAFGASTDIPVPADFDGDGKSELAVFRPSNGVWYLYNLATNQTSATAFGQSGDKPVPADYDGDSKSDMAVFRNGTWYLLRSTLGFTGISFGESTDRPVPADYDGDGKADVAVFRPSNGVWDLLQSTAGFTGIAFGFGTDLPVPADYDGDGKTDIAVFRDGTWYLLRSSQGFTGVGFGAANDKSIPAAFVQ